jgi:hypothetical protein
LQEKWDKAKRLLEEVWQMLDHDPYKMSRKRLEQIRGFLQYVVQTYSGLSSYLIEFNMTIDGFRQGQDTDGWRKLEAVWKEERKEDEDWSRAEVNMKEIPELVEAVPRFWDDVRALRQLKKADKPLSREQEAQNPNEPSTVLETPLAAGLELRSKLMVTYITSTGNGVWK